MDVRHLARESPTRIKVPGHEAEPLIAGVDPPRGLLKPDCESADANKTNPA